MPAKKKQHAKQKSSATSKAANGARRKPSLSDRALNASITWFSKDQERSLMDASVYAIGFAAGFKAANRDQSSRTRS